VVLHVAVKSLYIYIIILTLNIHWSYVIQSFLQYLMSVVWDLGFI